MNGRLSNFSLGAVIGLFLSVVFAGGLLVGIAVDRSRAPSASSGTDKDLQDFLTAYHLVTSNSYYRPFDKTQLVHAAIDGMLAATGDAHTVYFNPSQSRVANRELNGANFAGIGAIVLPTRRGLAIVTPLRNSPAQRAGLRPDDLVTAINGASVVGLNGEDAIARIHGHSGTVVRLTVHRQNGTPFTVPVRREQIEAVTAYGRMLPHNIGYVQIMSFGTSTGSEVGRALGDLVNRHARGIVLDLRGNPGGYVDAAQQVVSDFLNDGVVAYEQQSDKSLVPLNVLPGNQKVHVPVVVLVDSGTASAAEITAAALHDDAHSLVIGTKTYGKGSMQSVYTLSDGSTLRITDRLWLTPKKESIQRRGITPDRTLKPSAQQIQDGVDPQLRAAEAILAHTKR